MSRQAISRTVEERGPEQIDDEKEPNEEEFGYEVSTVVERVYATRYDCRPAAA